MRLEIEEGVELRLRRKRAILYWAMAPNLDDSAQDSLLRHDLED